MDVHIERELEKDHGRMTSGALWQEPRSQVYRPFRHGFITNECGTLYVCQGIEGTLPYGYGDLGWRRFDKLSKWMLFI